MRLRNAYASKFCHVFEASSQNCHHSLPSLRSAAKHEHLATINSIPVAHADGISIALIWVEMTPQLDLKDDDSDVEYPPEDTLGDQWRRGRTDEWEMLLSNSSVEVEASLHDRVSRLAYQFYVRRGKVPGHDLDDWFAAERIILRDCRV